MKNKFYAVIMAGGSGTRLWPLSRKSKPKQLHKLTSDKPMIAETYERLTAFFEPDKIVISTTAEHLEEIKRILSEIKTENFIVEPALMGNAAACALVSNLLLHRDPDSYSIFLPSDAFIKDQEEFLNAIDFSSQLLAKNPNHLITIGVKPTEPNVGYGYIKAGALVEEALSKRFSGFQVEQFVEKPDRATAEQYYESGSYFWNAGIFLWKNSHIIGLYQELTPSLYESIEEITKNWENKELVSAEYGKVENTSIDYAIIEKTKEILVVPADFGWSDIGSWGSLLQILSEAEDSKIISRGHHIGVDDENCLVMAGEKLVATIGMKDTVVIDTPDALLICNANESHKIKDLIAKLKEQGKENYL